MRELKFRRPLYLKGVFWIFETLQITRNSMSIFPSIEGGTSFNGCEENVLSKPDEQYIGIKDCEGNDIYEGDIIKRHNYLYVIRWYNEWACFGYGVVARINSIGETRPEIGDSRIYNFAGGIHSKETYIHGNIHQNPELLK